MTVAKHEFSRSTVPPGTRFGRYEVITQIASGGMATVYLGRALGAAGFARLVAIKCLHPHIAADEDFVVMFMDEARLAARIRHPNVVPTLDLEKGPEGLYLVMEYVEGDGLLGLQRAAIRARRRIPTGVVLRVVLDVLDGLHAAHELTGDRGEPLRLVHRDISPHNVLVGVDGVARITDFGIARAEERLGVTRDGKVKGKLAYMAPEQTSGQPVDRRADLFAVGVLLWECLAGRRLFHGQNDGEVLRNLLVNPIPRLREVVPELPEALDAVCARALERDPDRRFATAAAFAEALEQAGGGIGIGSARAVSQHVREVAGDKIDAIQQQVRAHLGEGAAHSAVRLVAPRARQFTDPERTVPLEPIASESLESTTASASEENTTVRSTPVPASLHGNESLPVLPVSQVSALGSQSLAPVVRRSRASALWIALAVLVGAGIGVFIALRSRGRSAPLPVAASGIRPNAVPALPLVLPTSAAPAPVPAAVPAPAPAPVPTPGAVPAPLALPVAAPEATRPATDSSEDRDRGALRRRGLRPEGPRPARPSAMPAGGQEPFNPESM